ncbi:MAG: penicillin-binding protein 1C [Crocinitomicaceae bacterium]|nr:penicillin-binding protein 1C [Crocinitomicaceae bacterium]
MRKLFRKIKSFLWRWKYLFLGLFLLNFIIWLNCLPKTLIESPTSTVVLDENGNLLAAQIADDGQWRFPYNPEVPEKYKKALIAFEDRTFESHWGVSLRGLSRAMYQNIKEGEVVSGGSTLTMQLMRISREGKSRSYFEKIIEIYMATRAEWRYSKNDILAMYASNAPMGGNVVGLDAASWRYFGRAANKLTWAESATLAVLPNSPGLIHPGKNRDALKEKRNRLLDILYDRGEIDTNTLLLSKMEPLPDKPYPIPQMAPHLLVKAIKDGKKGQVIHTTIKYEMQSRLAEILEFHHQKLKDNQIFNGAILVMEIESGEIKAYIGNTENEEAEHGSAVDIITSRRSTGSILKPFLYAGMLQDGIITPQMMIQDVPTYMAGYTPKNYNLQYDGLVPADKALARSLNVPLIRMLVKYGVPKLHYLLRKLDFTTMDRSASHYGLSLILGGAEVNLFDLVSAYGVMARSVKQYPEIKPGINRKASYLPRNEFEFNLEKPIIKPAAAWFTLEAMLEVARPEDDINWEEFSSSQRISWKTGTSFGFRDAWAVGINGKYVVGVWVGNADGEGRPGLIGREAAAPILFDVFSFLERADWFDIPYDEMSKVPLCRKSKFRASINCPEIDSVYIPNTSLRSEACPFHKIIHTTKDGAYRVNSGCEIQSNIVSQPWFIIPPLSEQYYKTIDPNFKTLPPFRSDCKESIEDDVISIVYPKEPSTIFVPRGFKGTKEKIVFEISHRNPSTKVYWHLDDVLIGETSDIHELELTPSPGEHTLTLVDEYGRQKTQVFTVLEK